MSQNFNETWPRWTRFMLNPTVGIELQAPWRSARRHWTSAGGSRRMQGAGTSVGPCSLEGKLAALERKETDVSQGLVAEAARAEPTTRTRNSDVFPAFCSPTKVTSISMALLIDQSACAADTSRAANWRRWQGHHEGLGMARVRPRRLPAHQKTRNNQLYTLRKRPAMLRSEGAVVRPGRVSCC